MTMPLPQDHPVVVVTSTLATLAALGTLAYVQQDPRVVPALDDLVDDGKQFAGSLGKAIKEIVAFGRRLGGTDDPTALD